MDLLLILVAIVAGVFAWVYFFGDSHSNDADGADNHRHDSDDDSDDDSGGDSDGGDGGGD